ncbi:MAG: TRAP transporter small permease [Betaproteobacteria bacterium]|nr:TRAP transporter small permease [Betaproteobacteria bacterium]
MRTLVSAFHHALNLLLVIATAVLIIPVSMQIFSRTIPIIPAYIWTEEMARFLFVWMIMIGAMVGIREGAHFDVDIWPVLGPRANAVLRIVSNMFVLVFAIVFVWWGIEFTRFGWNRISELAELPLWTIHVAWPVTGLTWLVFAGERLLDDARIVAKGAR